MSRFIFIPRTGSRAIWRVLIGVPLIGVPAMRLLGTPRWFAQGVCAGGSEGSLDFQKDTVIHNILRLLPDWPLTVASTSASDPTMLARLPSRLPRVRGDCPAHRGYCDGFPIRSHLGTGVDTGAVTCYARRARVCAEGRGTKYATKHKEHRRSRASPHKRER